MYGRLVSIAREREKEKRKRMRDKNVREVVVRSLSICETNKRAGTENDVEREVVEGDQDGGQLNPQHAAERGNANRLGVVAHISPVWI
jgi:hypothetical protein